MEMVSGNIQCAIALTLPVVVQDRMWPVDGLYSSELGFPSAAGPPGSSGHPSSPRANNEC